MDGLTGRFFETAFFRRFTFLLVDPYTPVLLVSDKLTEDSCFILRNRESIDLPVSKHKFKFGRS